MTLAQELSERIIRTGSASPADFYFVANVLESAVEYLDTCDGCDILNEAAAELRQTADNLERSKARHS